MNRSLLSKYGGLSKLLSKYYPHHIWKETLRPEQAISKFQLYLFKVTRNLLLISEKGEGGRDRDRDGKELEEEDAYLNYNHPLLKYEKSGKLIQLDIYFPRLQLALEAHGWQHYNTNHFTLDLEDRKVSIYLIYPSISRSRYPSIINISR